MRIGFPTFELSGPTTGAQPFDTSLIRALLALDDPPEMVLFVREEELPQYDTFSRRTEVIPVEESLLTGAASSEWYTRRLPELARENHLEVLHLPACPPSPWRGPCPALVILDDPASLREDANPDWKRKLLGRLATRKPVPLVDAFVATSELVADAVRARYGLRPQTVPVITKGIDHGRFAAGPAFDAKTEMDGRFELPEPFFLYNAPLAEPVGNQVGLVAAFNRFKRRAKSSWMLVLAGEEGEGAEKVHAAVQSSPYTKDIRLVGAVSGDDLPLLYRAADAFVFPSLAEAPGLAVVEAMACGCPVISSTRGVVGELVGEASSLIDPEDMDDISGKMAAMAGSLDLRKRWRAAGLAQAKKFDWARTAFEMMAVYERLADQPLRRPA